VISPGGVVLEFGPGVRWQIGSADAPPRCGASSSNNGGVSCPDFYRVTNDASIPKGTATYCLR
jgi:hypothetical protein